MYTVATNNEGFSTRAFPNIFTPALGLLRAGIALAHLLTLATTSTDYLIRPAAGIPDPLECSNIKSLSMYCLAPNDQLWIVRALGIAICCLCISGFLPRLSALLFFWLSFSAFNTWIITDGGDQVILNISLLVLLINMGEPRKNQWFPPLPSSNEWKLRIGFLLTALIKIQVFAIYFHAGVAKAAVDNWANGTEVYYDLSHPMFGANQTVSWLLQPFINNGLVVQILTWGTMVVEVFIAFAIFGSKRAKATAWVLAFSLHIGIAIFMGIVSFSIAMITVATFALLPFGFYISLSKGVSFESHFR